MNERAIHDARIELIDFAIETFWDAPTEQFVGRLLDGDVRVPGEEIHPALDEGFSLVERFVEENRDRGVEEIQTELRREYSRMLVGPRPPVVAHESYYLEDADFLGERLAEVQESYAAAGWSSPDEYPEEDDFVAVELAFLRHLIRRQRDGDETAFGYERVFLEEHVGRWIDEFAADVFEHTDETLFRAGARVAEGLVAFEEEIAAQQTSP